MSPRTLVFICFLIFEILLFSCDKRAEKSCFNPKAIDSPEIFSECHYGSGKFGRWIIDIFGLPAYEYTLSQEKQDIALWWNSEGKERREHWHQVGNSRISAAVYNEGYTQLFTQEGGFKWINYYDEQEQNLSGGFAYIYDGRNTWATAYRYRPEGSKTTRIFGVNYFFSETEYNDISVSRYIFSPQDDLPMLLTDVIIRNNGKTKKDIIYYEYWDVNFHHIIPELITSGLLDKTIPKNIREKRRRYNSEFFQKAFIRDGVAFIGTYNKRNQNKTNQDFFSADYDRSPPYVFLSALDKWNDKYSSLENKGYIFDQKEFFQARGRLESLEFNREINNFPGEGQGLALIHARRIGIEPGQIVKLRYAYGYTYSVDDFQIPQKYEEENLLQKVIDFWKKRLVYFSTVDDSYIQREMAWHSYYVLSSSYYRKYFGLHIVSQGGSYLFMHGYDGAPRDYCIFSIALNYIDPYLSKEILKFVMRMTYENGEIPYANYGDVFPVKIDLVRPSDLDIFFLWAISEYILSTRDFGFLNERVKFYDSEKDATVLEHIKVSFSHLFDVVGLGENGLIKFRTGDWSDGIRFFADNIEELEVSGESVFNTAFAVVVLPRLADILDSFDKDFSSKIRERAQQLMNSLQRTWNGNWYVRGMYGNGKVIGDDRIFLEPQVWAIIGGVADVEKAKLLINSIKNNLETELGAMIVYPPSEDVEKRTGLSLGTDVNGGIWPAINSLLTWAYSLYDPVLAWESFKKNMLSNHAELYPNLWYGIWSGPDSYNSPKSSRPGEAAAQFATSLADFPVMNVNAHANPIIALLKLSGISSYKDGLEFSPKVQKDFNLKLPYIGIKYKANKIEGYFKSITDIDGMEIKIKFSSTPKVVKVNGVETDFSLSDDGFASFSVKLSSGETVRWEIF